MFVRTCRQFMLGAALASLSVMSLNVVAQSPTPIYPNQKDGDYIVKNYRFNSGETLAEIKLHYTTLGTPKKDAAGHITNAVLLLHGTTGSSKSFFTPGLGGELFGPGQPLDAAKYYLIVPDGIAHGASSKPSDGLRARFPHYGYRDMVALQQKVVKDALGVDHLRLILGTSMGGMHAWLWATQDPTFMDAIVPLGCQPLPITGRNLLIRRVVIESIRHDPDWKGGDYTSPPQGWLRAVPLWSTLLDSALHLQSIAPTRQAALAYFDKLVETNAKNYDANDYLYRLESSFDYDPSADLAKVKARVLAINFADDELNPPELSQAAQLIATLPGARFIMIPASDKTSGHLTLNTASIWKTPVAAFIQELGL